MPGMVGEATNTVLDQEEIERKKKEAREIKRSVINEVRKPIYYNDPKIKSRISVGGGALFERTYR